MPTNGYAGYSPGSVIADKLNPLQAALRALPLEQAVDTLAIIDKLTRNTVRSPGDQKFRKINLTNDKIKTLIVNVPGAIALLKEMGWVQQGDSLELPSTVRLEHSPHVISIIDAQDYYKTQAAKEHSRQVRASKDVTPDQENLRKQMEIDRKEKAAEGPVTKSSVPTKMGDGANIVRASDLGIGKGGGG